jgi:hypothetical protein
MEQQNREHGNGSKPVEIMPVMGGGIDGQISGEEGFAAHAGCFA